MLGREARERLGPDRFMTKTIPAFVFNEHNEAFYYWHKARHDGFLSKPLDVFHIDAHSDMATIQKLQNSLYWNEKTNGDYLAHYRRIATEEMNIANFMIPAVLNSLIKNIYFICPEWRKFKRKRSKRNVASAFGEGKLFKHGIKILDGEKPKIQAAFPDFTEYGYIRTDIGQIPTKRKVILDVDLDYFACTDSITNRMSYELQITPEQYLNRKQFIRENESLKYSGLEIGFKKKGQNFFATVRFETQDDHEHLPTEAEIRKEMDRIIKVLSDKKTRPAVITICRSNLSGYCPPEYCQMIEEHFLTRLHSCFPAIDMRN